MQSSLTETRRWPWWFLASIAALSIAWWQPWHDDPAEPAAALMPDSAPLCAHDADKSVAPGQAATSAPALKLEGTVVGGAGSFAMVRHTADSRLVQLRVGDRVDDLVVTEIESGKVVLAGATGIVAIETWPQAATDAGAGAAEPAPPASAPPAPPLLPIEQLPEAYRGPAPENAVEGH
ncbi:hypothetical protein EGT29_21215 [Pigmentiphaga sp. H8]|uniref:hypothetical protein n=1 Tax=Pigmentiphaga sp. H8 TaxID=2488560 RepID=UPI000F5AF9A7|nr:hypothetical protein [Pigmentiphaga sp. H8]AZG10183.1 hypothetical protein EGT29_21215 [Pigmentiphaga sp. H8]